MRYGVGIGRDGFAWQGDGVIHWRQTWPAWKPPNEMVARQPETQTIFHRKWRNGGGLDNRLGHVRSIFSERTGHALSPPRHQRLALDRQGCVFGCVRLINQDIIDLYARVPYKAKIVVRQ